MSADVMTFARYSVHTSAKRALGNTGDGTWVVLEWSTSAKGLFHKRYGERHAVRVLLERPS